MKKKNKYAQPVVWGSHAWSFLHCVVMTYPVRPSATKQKEMTEFLMHFGKVLPCKLCRSNFVNYVARHPIRAATRIQLRNWIIDLHNAVNERLGKPVLSREEAIHEISRLCSNPH